MIKVLYFGVLREQFQRDEELIEWSSGDSQMLLTLLRSRGPDWVNALSDNNIFRVVVNHQIAEGVVPIADGSEVALLPPVTGG